MPVRNTFICKPLSWLTIFVFLAVQLLAWSGNAAAQVSDPAAVHLAAVESAAGAPGETDEPLPVFSLPPIAAQVFENDTPTGSMRYLKIELVFDEVDHDRILASLSVAKSLQPRLMDRVIGSLQGHRFDRTAQPNAMEDVVLKSSSDVLGPYGVVIKSVTIRDLGIH